MTARKSLGAPTGTVGRPELQSAGTGSKRQGWKAEIESRTPRARTAHGAPAGAESQHEKSLGAPTETVGRPELQSAWGEPPELFCSERRVQLPRSVDVAFWFFTWTSLTTCWTLGTDAATLCTCERRFCEFTVPVSVTTPFF